MVVVIFIFLKIEDYYSEFGVLFIYVLFFMVILGVGILVIIFYFLLSRDRVRLKRFFFIGFGINVGLSVFIIFFIFRGGVGDYNRVLIWIFGSFWGLGWDYVKIIILLVIIIFILVIINYKKLDVFNLLDEYGVCFGLNLNKERKKFLIFVVIFVGGVIVFVGNIGFIGLICLYIVRRLVGFYYKNFIVIFVIISVIIILFVDVVLRNLFFLIEIFVGIIILIFGVLYFIYLMMKEN